MIGMNRNYCFTLTNGARLDFKLVFDQYFNSLVLFADRYLEEREESESLVQDAFLALWENRLEFPDELSVKAYLYSTVRNKALNVLKHRKIEQHYMNEILQGISGIVKSQGMSFAVPDKEIIRKAMEDIDIVHFYMPFWLSRTAKKIADELKISLNTVKFHKKNAYKLLRDKLKDQFYLLFLI